MKARDNYPLEAHKYIEDLHKRFGGCVKRGVCEGERAVVLQDAQEGRGSKDEGKVRHTALDIGNTTVIVFFCRPHSFVISLQGVQDIFHSRRTVGIPEEWEINLLILQNRVPIVIL